MSLVTQSTNVAMMLLSQSKDKEFKPKHQATLTPAKDVDYRKMAFSARPIATLLPDNLPKKRHDIAACANKKIGLEPKALDAALPCLNQLASELSNCGDQKGAKLVQELSKNLKQCCDSQKDPNCSANTVQTLFDKVLLVHKEIAEKHGFVIDFLRLETGSIVLPIEKYLVYSSAVGEKKICFVNFQAEGCLARTELSTGLIIYYGSTNLEGRKDSTIVHELTHVHLNHDLGLYQNRNKMLKCPAPPFSNPDALKIAPKGQLAGKEADEIIAHDWGLRENQESDIKDLIRLTLTKNAQKLGPYASHAENHNYDSTFSIITAAITELDKNKNLSLTLHKRLLELSDKMVAERDLSYLEAYHTSAPDGAIFRGIKWLLFMDSNQERAKKEQAELQKLRSEIKELTTKHTNDICNKVGPEGLKYIANSLTYYSDRLYSEIIQSKVVPPK